VGVGVFQISGEKEQKRVVPILDRRSNQNRSQITNTMDLSLGPEGKTSFS
jgi:hypothetical protein